MARGIHRRCFAQQSESQDWYLSGHRACRRQWMQKSSRVPSPVKAVEVTAFRKSFLELSRFQELLHSSFLPCLPMSDLRALEALSKDFHATVHAAQAWQCRMRQILPHLRLAPELFNDHWPELSKLLPALLIAKPPAASAMSFCVKTLDEVRCISKLMASVVPKASPLLTTPVVHTLLSQLRFSDSGLEKCMSQGLSEALLLPESMSFADVIHCPFQAPCPFGLKGGDLRIHFAMCQGKLLVAARNDNLPSEEIAMPENYELQDRRCIITLDLCCRTPEIILSYRQVSVSLNCRWQAKFYGLSSWPLGPRKAATALRNGVLCGVCISTGCNFPETSVAGALNIDKPRREIRSV